MKLDEVLSDSYDYDTYDEYVATIVQKLRYYRDEFRKRLIILRRKMKKYYYLVNEGISEMMILRSVASYKVAFNELRAYVMKLLEQLMMHSDARVAEFVRKELEKLNDVMVAFRKYGDVFIEVLYKDLRKITREVRLFVDVVLPTLST